MTAQGLFCMSGIATYGHPDLDDLKHVPEELRTVRSALAELGLEELSPFDGDERDHTALADALYQWAQQPSHVDGTTLVIYSTGHGATDGGFYELARAGTATPRSCFRPLSASPSGPDLRSRTLRA